MRAPLVDVNAIDSIDALLPQTQCTRCGYADCRSYAQAVALDDEAINRCPPGGAEGIARLALATGRPATPLDPGCGAEGPVRLAVIDEAWCIGCTLCIKACPVDCIVGINKRMHTVIEAECTGCELCLPVCPVDCISLVDSTPGRSAWTAWSTPQAESAQQRYLTRNARRDHSTKDHALRLEAKAQHKLDHLETLTRDNTPAEIDRKRAVIEAALARSRIRRGAGSDI